MPNAPLVTVLLAVHDGEDYLRPALASVLGQTVGDLELLVVDDGSTDSTPMILAAADDARLRVIRNEERLGLAASLNRGLDEARGTYVARMDADDVAMPRRLERQLARSARAPCRRSSARRSSISTRDGRGRCTRCPSGRSPCAGPHSSARRSSIRRWSSSAPSSSDTTSATTRGSTRARTTTCGRGSWMSRDGDNLPEPLVLYRVHPEQASQRRRDVQRSFQLRVASRAIAAAAPELSPEDVELAWRIGAHEPVGEADVDVAIHAFLALLESFERRVGGGVRGAAARALVRLAERLPLAQRLRVTGEALRLDLGLSTHVLRRHAVGRAGELRREAEAWLARIAGDEQPPARVAAVFPEPTPYRAPLLDRVATQPEIDLTVLYAADTVAGRTWRVAPKHRAVFLRGVRIPGAQRVLHHDYPVTPGVVGALTDARPDVVVVSGWSTFAAQAAIAWCGLKDVPYLLVVESHDEGPRSGWRRTVEGHGRAADRRAGGRAARHGDART